MLGETDYENRENKRKSMLIYASDNRAGKSVCEKKDRRFIRVSIDKWVTSFEELPDIVCGFRTVSQGIPLAR